MKIKLFLIIFLFSFPIIAEYEDTSIIESPKVVFNTTVIDTGNKVASNLFDDLDDILNNFNKSDLIVRKKEIPNYIPAFMIDWGLKVLIWYVAVKSYSIYYWNKLLRKKEELVTKSKAHNAFDELDDMLNSLDD